MFKISRICFSTYDSDCSDRLGISSLTNDVVYDFKIPKKVDTYKIVLSLSLKYDFFNRDQYSEDLSFTYYGDLSKYVSEGSLDWYTFMRTQLRRKYIKQEFRFIKERLRKYKAKVPVAKVIYEPTDSTWHEKDYFLEFTEESAPWWAGPFKFNGKLGACLSIDENNDNEFPPIDPKQGSAYDLPYRLHEKLPDSIYYHLSPEEKAKVFDEELTPQEKVDFAKKTLEAQLSYMHENMPYRVYMCGNDDCSYSKWFGTKEEAEEEFAYLRMMQPLDTERDIRNRNYKFTN